MKGKVLSKGKRLERGQSKAYCDGQNLEELLSLHLESLPECLQSVSLRVFLVRSSMNVLRKNGHQA